MKSIITNKLCFVAVCLISIHCSIKSAEVLSLRTDLRTNPLGIDNPTPRFSWVIESDERGFQQSAYEILVSKDSGTLRKGIGNTWQSGKVSSNSTFEVMYKGKKIQSFTRYYWKVRTWDQKGKGSDWSAVSWFETAMMDQNDWKALWISDAKPLPEKDEEFYKEIPNPLLRKELFIKKEIRDARLYITGPGYYVAYINGQCVGDQMLDPGWTQYARQVLYSTFDVSDLLNKGRNAMGVMLGNGWYNPLPMKIFGNNLRNFLTVGKPCLKVQLRIVYADGSVETFITDKTWKTGEGPVLKNSVYLGETYDARLEQKGWNMPGFQEKSWANAIVIPGPAGQLTAQYAPPIRITCKIKPKRIYEVKPGVFMVDFGQNFAGVPHLKVNGPAGTTVTMRGGEDVHADSTLNFLTVITGQLKSIWNQDGGPGCPKDPINVISYTLKGGGQEDYVPQFTFSTFRYLEITGFPGTPEISSIEGLRMNSDLQETGSFTCSNEMFNKLQEIVKWTFLSNVFSVQSDCPAREKYGYGGDIVTTSGAFCYNYDMSSFYRKSVQDFANDARPMGGMTETAPYNGLADRGIGDNSGSLGWQLAFPVCLKQLYDMYGDRSILEKNFELLKKQVEFIRSIFPEHIVYKDISDHESLDPKPEALTATAFYYQHVEILAEIARILDKQTDVINYQNLSEEILTASRNKFLKKGTGIFDNGTQAAQLFAIYHKMVPVDEEEAAMKHLLEEIFYKHKGHLSTGIFSTHYLFDVCRTTNRNDAAYSIVNQRQFPGYGFMIRTGATTLWESWAYPDTVCSQNHPMFGSVSEWFYRSLLGINANEPGFRAFHIKPQPAGDLTWAKGYFDALTGRISSEWEISGASFVLRVSVPANTKAFIYVPSCEGGPVKESGTQAALSDSLKFVEYRNGYALFEALSGNYTFTSELVRN